MQVVGIANSYPLHMLQRRANWTVDYLSQIELNRVNRVLSPNLNKKRPPFLGNRYLVVIVFSI